MGLRRAGQNDTTVYFSFSTVRHNLFFFLWGLASLTSFFFPGGPIGMGFPGGASSKEPAYQCRRHKSPGFDPWVGKIPWCRAWQPTPVFLPGEFHGQRSLAGYSPQGHKELDTTVATEHTHIHYRHKSDATTEPFDWARWTLLSQIDRFLEC